MRISRSVRPVVLFEEVDDGSAGCGECLEFENYGWDDGRDGDSSALVDECGGGAAFENGDVVAEAGQGDAGEKSSKGTTYYDDILLLL